jgi:A/G-specific adenine glycosylase
MNLKGLIAWSEKDHSQLPWRQQRTLYRTLVSEIMLQQTTVGTVKNHFERFLVRFPTLESLALASEEELTIAWKGLGYYRRARNLKKIAEAIARDHDGVFPEKREELMLISGIGPYTASALVGIGLDKSALAVDANLERVIARLFNLQEEKGLKLQKKIQELFQEKVIFTQKVSFRKLNEALMDLGRTLCQARKASCGLCPLKCDCKAFESGDPLSLPRITKLKEKAQEHELELLRVYVKKGEKILVYKKESHEWLSGQYEVPTFILKTTDKGLTQYPVASYKGEHRASFKTGITKYKIENKVVHLQEADFKRFNFPRAVVWKDLHSNDSNFTTATLKGLKFIL